MQFRGPSAALFLSFILSSCSVTIPAPTPEETIQTPFTERDLGAYVASLIQPLIDLHINVGTIVGVITPQGEKIWIFENPKVAAKEGHLMDNTLFQIGSVSKVFTTSLLTELVQEGRVSLDEPMFKLAPALKFKSDTTGNITLAQLASHSSGLPREPLDLTMFWHVIRHFFNGANIYNQLDEKTIVDFVSNYEITASKLNHYYYSQLGIAYLGWSLGEIDHKGYAELVHEKILAPLGLTDTVFTPSDDQMKRMATSHSGDVPAFVPRTRAISTWDDIPEGFRPAGGFFSTAGDLMKFLRAQMGLSHPELYPAFKLAHLPITSTRKGRVGLGWFIETLARTREPYIYAGGVSSGHTSFIGFSDQYKVGVVVLQNSINLDDQIGETLLDRMVETQKLNMKPEQ